jgi:hypothetical protein
MYRNDPRDIKVRYSGHCASCGKPIKAGETGFYYPVGKKLYGDSCGCADPCRRDFASAAFDENTYAA